MKYQPKKKRKKWLEISSFYTGVPKIMIIDYTVPEICCMIDVIVIFHLGQFLAQTAQKMKIKKKKKMEKMPEISSFNTSVPKMLYCS